MDNRVAAATVIQKVFRGSHVRFFGPRNIQMEYHPLGHETLRVESRSFASGLKGINKYHELWSEEINPVKINKVTFNDYTEVTDDPQCEDRCEMLDVEFRDGKEKPSFAFAQVINAAFERRPIYNYLSGDKPIGSFFDEAIRSLEAGKRFSIWDGHSTKIPATPACISIVKTCQVKYNFFTMAPSRTDVKEKIVPSKVIQCGPVEDEFTVEDLWERLRKLKLLSHAEPVMAYPVL